jgi:hypothetical protein
VTPADVYVFMYQVQALVVSEGGLAYPYSTSIVTNGVQLYSGVLFVP